MYSPTSSPHSHTYQADSPSEWNLGDDQLEEEEALISASVTDEQLATLAGTTELASVTFLKLAVDSTHVPLGTRLGAALVGTGLGRGLGPVLGMAVGTVEGAGVGCPDL